MEEGGSLGNRAKIQTSVHDSLSWTKICDYVTITLRLRYGKLNRELVSDEPTEKGAKSIRIHQNPSEPI